MERGQNGFVILDFETTGLSKTKDAITEVAAIKIEGEYITDKFETFVNPGRTIPKYITRLTGISDDMVKDAPSLESVLTELHEFIGDYTIIAHNANFDYGFLSHNAKERLGIEIQNRRLCTKELAKKVAPNLPKRSLSYLCDHFEIENENAHRAMADVKATFQLFNIFREIMYKDHGIQSTEEILEFCNSPESMKPRVYRLN